MRIEATSPPTTGLLLFLGTSSSLSIPVPTDNVDIYKGDDNWSDYAGQITGY